MKVGVTEAKWTLSGWAARFVERLVIVLVSILGVGVLGLGAWMAVEAFAARDAERKLEAGWAEMGRSLDSILVAYPRHGANETALRIEDLASSLGIGLAPRSAARRLEPDMALVQTLDAVKPALREFATRVSSASRRSVGPIPEDVAAYLNVNSGALAKVSSLLVSADIPAWEQEFSSLDDGPVPGLLGHITLARLLVARAVLLDSSGNVSEARQSIEAAWRLHESVVDRPEAASEAIGIAEAMLSAGAMRVHSRPGDRWPSTLLERDLRESVLRGFHGEAWRVMERVRRGDTMANDGLFSPLVRWIATPFLRRRMTARSDAIRRGIRELENGELAGFDAGERYAVAYEDLASGDALGRATLPDLWRSWVQASRATLCLELTADVIDLRFDIARRGVAAVTELPVERPSRVAPSVVWQIARNRRGVLFQPAAKLPMVGPVAAEGLCSSFLVEVANE